MIVYPKINLGLKVLRKRPDGYHDLETLFVPCTAFHDELHIVEAGKFSIDIDRCDWNPASDLTAAAYRLLADEFGIPPVHIELRKGIPVGAGLGGGSSDAAAALRLISELYSLGLSDDALASRAARLGSDCPFFVYGRPMFGEGRGEILSPFDIDLSAYEMRVELPEGVHVSTRKAYSGLKIAPVAGPSKHCVSGSVDTALSGSGHCDASLVTSGFGLREALRRPVAEWRDCLVNDFEATVFAVHPEIAALKARFYAEGAEYASMSGSGSAVFGLWLKPQNGDNSLTDSSLLNMPSGKYPKAKVVKY